MLPLKLKIKGLYSYKEEAEIDFAQLCEGQLFGIFGEVGSGKSSILEAISYALYGECERLNARERRSYNMMNLASSELLIDYIFICGKNNRYRFLVEGRRNSKNFEDAGTFSRRAFLFKDADWQPLEHADCTDIIGLTYENFRRTIIIPQGKFQDFLHLTEANRTKMLKELFRLQRFDLFSKAKKLDEENNHEIAGLNGELKSVAEATEESITAAGTELAQLQKDVAQLNSAAENLTNEYNAQKAVKELAERLESTRANLYRHNERQGLMAARKRDVEDYETCQDHFSHLFEEEQKLKEEQAERETNLQQLEHDLAKLQKSYRKNKDEFEKLQRDHKDEKKLQQQLQDLENLIEADKVKLKLVDTEEAVENARYNADKAAADYSLARENLATLKKNLTKLKEGAPDVRELVEVKNWFSARIFLEERLGSLQKELAATDLELDALAGRKEDIVAPVAGFAGVDIIGLKANKINERLQGFIGSADAEIDKLLQVQQKWLTRQELEGFAVALAEGEPCPLCGSGHHPQKLEKGDAEKHIEEAKLQLQKLKERKLLAEGVSNKINVLIESYRSLTKQKEKQQQEINAVVEKLELHNQKFPSKKYKGIGAEKLDELLKQSEVLENQVKQAEQEILSVEKAVAALEASEKKFAKELQQSTLEAEKLKTGHDQLLYSLKVLDPYKYSHLLPHLLEDAKMHAQELMAQFSRLQEETRQQSQQMQILKVQTESAKKEIHSIKMRYKELLQKLDERISSSRFENLGEVAAIIEKHKDMDLPAEKAVLDEWFEEQKRLKFAIEDLIKQLKGKDWHPEKFTKLEQEKTAAEKELNEKQKALAVLAANLELKRQQLARRQQLEAKLEKLAHRAENISTLKNLFKGQGFVNYISTVYLQQLCEAANQRFQKLTRQSLSMEVSEDNNLYVRDYLNEGRLRSIKTLSGGQTFQASLCLALALADQVASLHKADQNFFFLDEGFGSLDANSLKVVFEALKSLRQENRIVGIISHVEDLQEEIDIHLRVLRSEERGSYLVPSWI